MGRIADHFRRVRYQLGERVTLGSRAYRVRGYFANNLSVSAEHEPQVAEAIARTLKRRNGAFLDVGANLGQTLTKVLAVEPSRRYLGFEPQVGCCHVLGQFIRDNGIESAAVFPVALSHSNGFVELYSTNAFDDQASLMETGRPDGQKRGMRTYVPVRVGDEVMAEVGISEIACIKIDVEGAEIAVLRGFQKSLEVHRPDVLFEVLPNFFGHERIMREGGACEHNRALAQELFELLTDWGYEVQQLVEGRNPTKIAEFALDDREGFVGSDYIATAR